MGIRNVPRRTVLCVNRPVNTTGTPNAPAPQVSRVCPTPDVSLYRKDRQLISRDIDASGKLSTECGQRKPTFGIESSYYMMEFGIAILIIPEPARPSNSLTQETLASWFIGRKSLSRENTFAGSILSVRVYEKATPESHLCGWSRALSQRDCRPREDIKQGRLRFRLGDFGVMPVLHRAGYRRLSSSSEL